MEMFDDERLYFYFGDRQARKQLSCLHKNQFSPSPYTYIYINKVEVQALNGAAGYSKFCYVFPLLCLKELCSFCFHNPLLSFFPSNSFPFLFCSHSLPHHHLQRRFHKRYSSRSKPWCCWAVSENSAWEICKS